MAAVLKGRKRLPVAETEDDFEAGPSDEEPEEDAGGSSGSGSDDELDAAGSAGEDDEQDEDFGSDDGVEEGMPSNSEGEGEEEEEEQQGGSGSGSGSDDEEGSGGRKGGFLEGSKAASFAKAFAKILDTSGKKAAEAAGPAPILAVSKSIAKRKAEVEAEAKADREAKKLRQEMKQRGHVVPKRRGQDPTADVREKALQRLATKGVVRLFNAIAKAQKQLREAEEASGSRAKAVKLGKASFLAQLKGSSAAAAGSAADQPLVPSAPRQAIPGVAAAAAVPAAGASGSKKQQQRRGAAADSSSEDEEDAAGWDVLKQGFVGLQGGGKMKDWDKEGSDEEGAGGDQLEGLSSDDE